MLARPVATIDVPLCAKPTRVPVRPVSSSTKYNHMISLVPDCTRRLNYFSYVNATEPDPFGILRFLTDELQAAEDAGERGGPPFVPDCYTSLPSDAIHGLLSGFALRYSVWIIGHVNSGWDGTQSQMNPTNLCMCLSIFLRHSPDLHVSLLNSLSDVSTPQRSIFEHAMD